MTRRERIVRKYKAEFHIGERIAFRTHVASSRRVVIAECWRILGRANRSVDKRDARHALYLGALKAHEANRAFVRKWRL